MSALARVRASRAPRGHGDDTGRGHPRSWVASTAFLIAWWFTLGPVTLGGPATFVVVDGESMEPVYSVGDLVVARARAEHSPGDIAVFYAPDRRRYVIHRLETQLDDGAWLTIGDNNDRRDSWTVPDGAILGTEWFVIPRLGLVLFWVQDHPFHFGGAVAVLVVLLSVRGRRRRLHPDLAAALEVSQRASWRAGRPAGDLLLLGTALATFALAVIVLQSLMNVRMIGSVQGRIMLTLAAVSAAIATVLYLRLVEGRGVPEPLSTRFALSGIVWDTIDLPDVASAVDHPGPRSLRRFADEHTGHVLRTTETDTDVEVLRETYLTIDVDGVGHRWVVESGVSDDTSDAADDTISSIEHDELPVPPPPTPSVAPTPVEPTPVEPTPVVAAVAAERSESDERFTAMRAEIDARFTAILAEIDGMRAAVTSPVQQDVPLTPGEVAPDVTPPPVGSATSFEDILAQLDAMSAGLGK